MDPGGSDLFKDYEQDFTTLITSLEKKLNDLSQGTIQGEQWKTLIRAIEREVEEAVEILSSMDNELHALAPPVRAKLQGKFQQNKSSLEKIRKDFGRIRQTPSAREALLGPAGAPAAFDAAGNDQRTRLLEGTERLNQASDRLSAAHRVAIETEQTGVETLQELRRQREQLQRTRNTLRNVDSNVDRAQRTLRTMARRLASNKIITGVTICMLIFLIILVLALKFR